MAQAPAGRHGVRGRRIAVDLGWNWAIWPDIRGTLGRVMRSLGHW